MSERPYPGKEKRNPLRRWATFVHRHRVGVLAASCLAAVASAGAIAAGGRMHAGEFSGLEAEVAREQLERSLGMPGETSFLIVFSSPNLRANEAPFEDALRAALAPIEADPRVARVVSPIGMPEMVASHLRSADGHHALAVVQLKHELRVAAHEFPEIRGLLRPGPLQHVVTGFLGVRDDLDSLLRHDLIFAELLSVPLALFVLLWVFRTWVAALLPVLVGGLAVLTGIAATFVLSRFVDMVPYTVNLVSLIGSGVAIDYSLFIVSRYRGARALGLDVGASLGRSIETAGHAVLFSGLAVCVGFSGLFFFPGSYLAAMGLGGSIVVLLSVVSALATLPALLSILGDRIEAGRVDLPELIQQGRWRQIASWVMKRPVAVLVPLLLLLLVVGSPFFRLRLEPVDVSILPRSAEARRGFELLASQFPEQTVTRFEVVVEFPTEPAFTPARAGALFDLSRSIAKIPGVRAVESIVDVDPQLDRDDVIAMASTPEREIAPTLLPAYKRFVGKRVVLLSAISDLSPVSDDAIRIVREIRRRRTAADGAVLVTGPAARNLDINEFISAHAPLAVVFVMSVSGFVLFLALGSVLLPLKAILMNLLSISASFGALVFIFQDGHFASLLGFEARPIEPSLPVLLFCCVFGLSMDYEVLLLERIREEYRRGATNTVAVAEGLEKSASQITSAAAIMVTLFTVFGFTEVVLLKAVGIGLALAVALDATVVRLLIVPATMRLFGDLNWWAPKWTRRFFGPTRVTPVGVVSSPGLPAFPPQDGAGTDPFA